MLCVLIGLVLVYVNSNLLCKSTNIPLLLSCYVEFLQMAVNFEECRKKWLMSGDELVSCKEMLTKAETEKGALEVKLKHARNQVDVEIRRRQKAEAVYEKLVRPTQIC